MTRSAADGLVAIPAPPLGADDETVRVSAWLVEPGDVITTGNRLVELLVSGITFDVSVDVEGVLERIEKPIGTAVVVEDTLGWIRTSADHTHT